ncbi:MAG: hypothetical protein Q7T05_02595 [Dehalococcoidia bacterium]|nr:hypothetical protein [Dehalococcoidia bacterium]
MKPSVAIAQGRWELAAHLVIIGLVRASRRDAEERDAPRKTKDRTSKKRAR